jgi:hypothetical protein
MEFGDGVGEFSDDWEITTLITHGNEQSVKCVKYHQFDGKR